MGGHLRVRRICALAAAFSLPTVLSTWLPERSRCLDCFKGRLAASVYCLDLVRWQERLASDNRVLALALIVVLSGGRREVYHCGQLSSLNYRVMHPIPKCVQARPGLLQPPGTSMTQLGHRQSPNRGQPMHATTTRTPARSRRKCPRIADR